MLIRIQTHLQISQLTKRLLETGLELAKANRELNQKNTELQREIQKREQAEWDRDQAREELQKADEQLAHLSQQEAEWWGIPGFVAQSRTMAEILARVRRLHHNDTTSVLITGESGTGKELIARAIHYGGPRAKGPFFTINCSAIPKELAESTLFGHVRGAFTGATTDKKGYFELASDGTIFLDEVGDMPLELQAKLFRVLEYGVFTPVGRTEEKQTHARILSATNADLPAKIAAGEFREELYFRLARFTVAVPPLRKRPEDIPLLISHFLDQKERRWLPCSDEVPPKVCYDLSFKANVFKITGGGCVQADAKRVLRFNVSARASDGKCARGLAGFNCTAAAPDRRIAAISRRPKSYLDH